MTDRFAIDHHKIHYHVDRLAAWLEGRDPGPIYAEISPTAACNLRCSFCALDFARDQGLFIDREVLLAAIPEMAAAGLRSVMFGGEGEPLLHPDTPRFIARAKEAGIDTALTTNGILLSGVTAGTILPHLSWMKVSINAGTAVTYARIHRCTSDTFATVVANLEATASLRARIGSSCALGAQALLLPENAAEMEGLAGIVKGAGFDYLVIKPFSQHPKMKGTRYAGLRYRELLDLGERLRRFDDERFSVIFRASTMESWDEGSRPYQRCLALPFWFYVDSRGDVWGCPAHLGDDRFRYGSLAEEGFGEIWRGERRSENLRWVAGELDPAFCRVNCRMDKVNRFLWELRHPPEHVNFV
jgi:radical SAM protein with 4Fe4S-binding SPASM domain